MTTLSAFLLQDNSNAAGAVAGGIIMLISLAVSVVFIAGLWKVFAKAGQPGWAAIIPIYNAYILLKIAGRPGWWLILLLIPLVNIVISVLISIDIAKAFGQSPAWGVILLCLLCGIGYLILGFGSATYQGPTGLPVGGTQRQLA
jgi:Ca2+/Na+ antiporter